MGKTTTVIWDWNGTLLDDAPVCVAAINDMLRERSLPQLSAERYQEIFCFPVSEDVYKRQACSSSPWGCSPPAFTWCRRC